MVLWRRGGGCFFLRFAEVFLLRGERFFRGEEGEGMGAVLTGIDAGGALSDLRVPAGYRVSFWAISSGRGMNDLSCGGGRGGGFRLGMGGGLVGKEGEIGHSFYWSSLASGLRIMDGKAGMSFDFLGGDGSFL